MGGCEGASVGVLKFGGREGSSSPEVRWRVAARSPSTSLACSLKILYQVQYVTLQGKAGTKAKYGSVMSSLGTIYREEGGCNGTMSSDLLLSVCSQ